MTNVWRSDFLHGYENLPIGCAHANTHAHETESVLWVDRPVEGAVAQHWHSTVENSTVEQCWDTAAPAGISIASSTGTGSRKVGQQPIEGLNI